MRKVLFVGGPRHGDTIEADGYAIKLPMERWDEAVILQIEKLSDDQFIARWPEGVEWRPAKFKVGDRVQLAYGTVATVHTVHSGQRYSLKFSDGGWCGLYPEHELIPAPTLEEVIDKSSRRFYDASSRIPNRTRLRDYMAADIRKAFPDAKL